jgi:hypothetical protein
MIPAEGHRLYGDTPATKWLRRTSEHAGARHDPARRCGNIFFANGGGGDFGDSDNLKGSYHTPCDLNCRTL